MANTCIIICLSILKTVKTFQKAVTVKNIILSGDVRVAMNSILHPQKAWVKKDGFKFLLKDDNEGERGGHSTIGEPPSKRPRDRSVPTKQPSAASPPVRPCLLAVGSEMVGTGGCTL